MMTGSRALLRMLGTLAIPLGMAVAASPTSAQAQKPNILVIMGAKASGE
jgi:hypothetical protein